MRPGKRLGRTFYRKDDVVALAKALLGKLLVTRIGGARTSGRIVETEAYRGHGDRACHAHGGRRTARNQVMYEDGGTAYLYLCYGIHTLFNVVTNRTGKADAILVRAIEPVEGIELMAARSGKKPGDLGLGAGPGLLTRSLGMTVAHSGTTLLGDLIWIEDCGEELSPDQIVASPRVGVGYAGPDAMLPWRFRVKGSRWTSRAR
ncbi:MAG: DNA-3-methyladenine glycosylase [Candidatus Methylacidiphilales bacterium]